MISQFRRYTDSWIARVFFIIMAVSFVGWGISGDLFRLMGSPSWVAKVGGQTIEIPAFQSEFQRAMAQETRNLPSGQEASADVRHRVGQQTLQRMVAQAAIGLELKDLRIVTPDDALAAVVRSMPAFRGPMASSVAASSRPCCSAMAIPRRVSWRSFAPTSPSSSC